MATTNSVSARKVNFSLRVRMCETTYLRKVNSTLIRNNISALPVVSRVKPFPDFTPDLLTSNIPAGCYGSTNND